MAFSDINASSIEPVSVKYTKTNSNLINRNKKMKKSLKGKGKNMENQVSMKNMKQSAQICKFSYLKFSSFFLSSNINKHWYGNICVSQFVVHITQIMGYNEDK